MKFILGIDPDKGWALARGGTKRLISAGTVKDLESILRVIKSLEKLAPEIEVRIELPTTEKVFFRKFGLAKDLENRINMKIAANVGQNREKAKFIKLFCVSLSFAKIEFVPPARKKINHCLFKSITGTEKRISQHARDAAMIAIR